MIRNWGWYEIISLDSGLTQKEIDKHLLGDQTPGERSVFGEMKRHCRSPSKRPRKGTSKGEAPHRSAYQLVHAEGRYDDARRWYESSLWETLSNRNLTESDHNAVIQQRIKLFNNEHGTRNDKETLLSQLALNDGFLRATEAYPQPTLPESAKFPPMVSHCIDRMRPIEELELYSALFRLKIASPRGTLSLIHAWIKMAFSDLVRAKPFDEEAHREVKMCLRLLIEDRIVESQWWTKENYIDHCKKKGKKIDFDDYVAWYNKASVPFGAPALLKKLDP